MVEKNKNDELAVNDPISKQNSFVFKENNFTKSSGKLNPFEQRVLDYCFSFVTEDSTPDKEYEVAISDIISHLGLSNSGDSYKRVEEAFKRLNENISLYIPVDQNNVPAIQMSEFDLRTQDKVYFRYSDSL